MIDVLQAISESSRYKIIQLLAQKSLCVCEIAQKLQLPQNLVSHHLAVLKKANIIENCRCGKNNYYSLNHKTIRDLINTLSKLGGQNEN